MSHTVTLTTVSCIPSGQESSAEEAMVAPVKKSTPPINRARRRSPSPRASRADRMTAAGKARSGEYA